jgi:hypothetical protein
MLACIFAFAAEDNSRLLEKSLSRVATGLAVVAIASMATVWVTFGQSLTSTRLHSGYLARQPVSLSVFQYSELREEIDAAARMCGFEQAEKQSQLMIDDATYFAFMKSHLPHHQLGVLGEWRGSIDNPIDFLRERKSSGYILGCHLLTDEVRLQSKQYGRICCMSVTD